MPRSMSAGQGGNDETHNSCSFGSCSFDCIFSHRRGDGPVLRKPGGQRNRQAASWRRQKQLREEVQEGRLRKQGGQRRGQAAARRGQEQFYGKMQKGYVTAASGSS